ncbi:hypothetical protein MHLP_01545 [Candidatus Mycoplasma haematolamae str. Purdue]|uniref:Uncharacterized protein n=1 Tax=Mycoplasma haematolamae (strain Purdue) TaxID=1212765 RepID=I7CJ40_MYCHA|nr:hypothetical protein [Candidatus Mycoplasma haematolamae]AFO51889.1 hypothetical protein MHLP_01545 [Candidatus Mycoplasma haematolamae str. Purdue]
MTGGFLGKAAITFLVTGTVGYEGYEALWGHPIHDHSLIKANYTADQYHNIKCATFGISKGWGSGENKQGPDILDCGFRCP